MIHLSQAIAECLQVHAEAVEKFGTDRPEESDNIPSELREKMTRQRAKVDATLQAVDPSAHIAHLEALIKGLRLVMRRLEATDADQAVRSEIRNRKQSTRGE
jgi:hypothetical protein